MTGIAVAVAVAAVVVVAGLSGVVPLWASNRRAENTPEAAVVVVEAAATSCGRDTDAILLPAAADSDAADSADSADSAAAIADSAAAIADNARNSDTGVIVGTGT